MLLALAVGIVLYTRFSLNDRLSRDEGLYAYAGQRFAHGVPFYTSIFEQKTPLAAILAGIGAWGARIFGGDDLYWIRLVFFAFALLTVVGVHLLGSALWRSQAAGLASAVAFAAFTGFAADALGGPDAKTPGICFGVFSMALLVRRRWFWGASLASLAFLVWQPLLIYVAVALVAGRRRLGAAAAGAAIPLVLVGAYMALAGAFGRMLDGAFAFPATGLQRKPSSVGQRLTDIADAVHGFYGIHGEVLLAGGLIALCVPSSCGRSGRHGRPAGSTIR